MSTLTLTRKFGELGTYEKFLEDSIEKSENENLFIGYAQPPKTVRTGTGENLTLGFGYDVTSRRSHPEKVLDDLGKAGIELDNKQRAAVLYYGGVDKAAIEKGLAGYGTPSSQDDRDFIRGLDANDRTAEELRIRLKDVLVTKTQGEALLRLVLREKERALDEFLNDRDNAIPQDIRDRLKEHSDQRAVLVDMFYQSRNLVGPKLAEALAKGDMAAAALEIAFLSNATPEVTSGIDERNFARAEAFLGGTLAPRTPEEAQAFLAALANRSVAISQAQASRASAPKVAERYRDRLNALLSAAMTMRGKRAWLELRPDGAFAVREAATWGEFAGLFGIAPNDVGLLVWSAPDGEAGGGVLAPGDVVRLPGATEQLAILLAGGGFSAEPAAGLEAIVARRAYFEDYLAWLTGSLDVRRLRGRSPFLDPSWAPGERWFEDQRRLPFDLSAPTRTPWLDLPPPVAPGRRSHARGARGTDRLSKESIELIGRKLDLMMESAIRLRDILRKVAKTPIKVTAKGPWGG